MSPSNIILVLLSSVALIGLTVANTTQKVPQNPPASCECTTCAYGSYCTEENGNVVCKCPPICMTFIAEKPICGSDGTTYAGLCAMEHEACIKRMEVTKAYDGKCRSPEHTLELLRSASRLYVKEHE